MKLLLRWLFSAGLLMLIAYYLPGVHIFSFYNALIAALILGLINAIIRPIVLVLTLPVTVITLGLFSLSRMQRWVHDITSTSFLFASSPVADFPYSTISSSVRFRRRTLFFR
jgi:uncharacterized membrane protein YvlD (DUF360 family)